MASFAGLISATTWVFCPGVTWSSLVGENVTCHPLGGVALKLTPVSGAEPVLLTTRVSRLVWLEWPERLRRPSVVAASSVPTPDTTAARSIFPVAPLAPVTSTSIGYLPDWVLAGGVAETLIWDVPPPSTVTVFARDSAAGEAVTVHPSGPVPAKLNVCWAGVLLVSVSVYEKVSVGPPFNEGKSAVSAMPLSTWLATVTVRLSVLVPWGAVSMMDTG